MGRIFFSFSGRIGRQAFWLAVLALVVAVIALLVVAGAAFGVPQLPVHRGPGPVPNMDFSQHLFLAGAAISIVMIWPSLAIMVKRLHDRDWSAWWIAGFYVLAFIPFAVAMAPAIGLPILAPGGALSLIMAALTLMILAASIWLLVETGFLRGTIGPNRFGDDPMGGLPESGASRPGDNWAS